MKQSPIYILFFYTLTILVCSETANCQVNSAGGSANYSLIETGKSLNHHKNSLEQANLEPYRLRNEDRVLTFDDGVQFTLYSAVRLITNGADLNPTDYPTKQDINSRVSLVFTISADDRLLVRSEIESSSKLGLLGKGFPSKERVIITQSDFDQMPKSKQKIVLERPHQYKIE